MRPFSIVSCALFAAGISRADPVAIRWTAETSRPAPVDIPAFQGETLHIEPAFASYGTAMPLTNTTAALYWQTNGMAAAWWCVPAAIVTGDPDRVRAVWSPTNDVGASRYTWFISTTAANGASYRAYGTLMMRSSPGATPAILAAPTTLSDAMQAWADARYDAIGAAQVVSNALADAMQHIQPSGGGDSTNWQPIVYSMTNGAAMGATALQPSWAATGTVHHAVLADVAYGLLRPEGGAGTDGEALDAATAHIADVDGTAHPDIREAIDGSTNALIQTYLLGTNAWMTISNQTLTIWRTIDGVSTSLWSSAESGGSGDEIDLSFTNTLMSALSAKADKAWGQYAPDGSPNPDPAYMTYLNAPATMHASGYQWATYGAYSVMAESGAVAYESGADGTARWGLDLHTNYVGFVRGGSVIVAAKAGAINVTGGGTTNGIAEIVYPYTAGDFPALWHAPALDVPFTLQEGVVWVDNQDGTATVTAPATAPKGFWYATTTITYDVIFDIRPPARLTGGVIGSTNAAPVVYDSVIEIESGGKNYRIPAQQVP